MVSLSNSTPNRKITLKKVKDNILNKGRRKEIKTYHESHAFVTESRGRSQSRFSHGKQDKESSDRESGNRKDKWKREISVKERN